MRLRTGEVKYIIAEDRHKEARDRFKECLKLLPTEKNSDEEYISLFCDYYLGAYENQGNLEEIKQRALSLGARATVRRFLLFP